MKEKKWRFCIGCPWYDLTGAARWKCECAMSPNCGKFRMPVFGCYDSYITQADIEKLYFKTNRKKVEN